MQDVRDESLLPEWLRTALDDERAQFLGSRFPQHLGATAYQVYDLGDGVWVWDNGTGGVLISDGKALPPGTLADPMRVRWINYSDLGHEHPHWTEDERVAISKMIAQRYGK
jgi:hypothetical protein